MKNKRQNTYMIQANMHNNFGCHIRLVARILQKSILQETNSSLNEINFCNYEYNIHFYET